MSVPCTCTPVNFSRINVYCLVVCADTSSFRSWLTRNIWKRSTAIERARWRRHVTEMTRRGRRWTRAHARIMTLTHKSVRSSRLSAVELWVECAVVVEHRSDKSDVILIIITTSYLVSYWYVENIRSEPKIVCNTILAFTLISQKQCSAGFFYDSDVRSTFCFNIKLVLGCVHSIHYCGYRCEITFSVFNSNIWQKSFKNDSEQEIKAKAHSCRKTVRNSLKITRFYLTRSAISLKGGLFHSSLQPVIQHSCSFTILFFSRKHRTFLVQYLI